MALRMRVLALMFLGIPLLVVGCAKPAPTPAGDSGAGATSSVDYVNKSFGGRPIGAASAKFKPGSAKDGKDGKVQIEDLTGAKYEVTVTSEGSSYKASDPKPLPK